MRESEIDAADVEGDSEAMNLAAERVVDPRDPLLSPEARALAIVRASNRALIQATGERALLEEVCRIAVELGGCRLAWVGYARDDPARSVQPVAYAGDEAGYLSTITPSWADVPEGRGPVGIAIRTGQPVAVQRASEDARLAALPWREEVVARGFRALLALPLADGDVTIGVLALYSDDPDAFGPAQVDLLSELSADLGFGVVTLRLRAERERLAAAVEQSEVSTVISDAERRVVYANAAYLRATGLSLEEVLGRPATEIAIGVQQDEALRDLLEAAAAHRPWFGELDWGKPCGEQARVQIRLTPLHDPDGRWTGDVFSVGDLTALRSAQAELAIAQLIQEAQVRALRRIGDDATLVESAQALCDELATLPFVDLAGVEAFVNGKVVRVVGLNGPDWLPMRTGEPLPADLARQQRALAAPEPWAVPLSSGDGPFNSVLAAHGFRALAYGPLVHGTHLDGGLIIATADETFGRLLVERMPGIVSFSATASALLSERLHLQRASLERRAAIEAIIAAGAFHPVFQPIVELDSREIVGYEALTRFDSEARPDRCFADAWRLGLGPGLELATLAAAVEAGRALPAGCWLDLNVSPGLLADPHAILRALGRPGRPIVIEITEHEPIADYGAVREAIRALGPGVRLAVDDAGAGAANFGHIIGLRPDLVKLDMSLVRNVNEDLGRQAMVVGMRHFSRTAGCQLVAEGIETEEEAATLAHLGVAFGQGFVFGEATTAPRCCSAASRQAESERTRTTRDDD